MTNLLKAYKLLKENEYTLVLYDGKNYISSKQRGVYYLLSLYESKKDYSNFVAADKVIGKGAAVIYVLLKIKEIKVNIISKPALNLLLEHNIKVEYNTLVDNIINRQKTGICYIEEACLNISDLDKALIAIKKRLVITHEGKKYSIYRY